MLVIEHWNQGKGMNEEFLNLIFEDTSMLCCVLPHRFYCKESFCDLCLFCQCPRSYDSQGVDEKKKKNSMANFSEFIYYYLTPYKNYSSFSTYPKQTNLRFSMKIFDFHWKYVIKALDIVSSLHPIVMLCIVSNI